jgi:hypothetical protein
LDAPVVASVGYDLA